MSSNLDSLIFVTDGPPPRRLRFSTANGMIAVAGSAVVLAIFRVDPSIAAFIAAPFASTLIVRPSTQHDWLLLVVAAIGAFPCYALAGLWIFALRVTRFVGHWPSYGYPDPKDVPAHFHPQTELLESLGPAAAYVAVTFLLVKIAMRFKTWSRRMDFASLATCTLWVLQVVYLLLDPAGLINWWVD